MSELDFDIKPHEGTVKDSERVMAFTVSEPSRQNPGGRFGFFLNRTQVPLLTAVTRPQNVTRQLSTFFTSSGKERKSVLGNPDLFKFSSDASQNKEIDKEINIGERPQSPTSLISEITIDTDTVRLRDETKISQAEHTSGSGEQHDQMDKRQAVQLNHAGTPRLGVSYDEKMDTLSLAHHDPVSVYFDSLEQQIIQQEFNKEIYQSKSENSPRKGQGISSSDLFRKGHGQFSQCECAKRNSLPRSHTGSVCSNCSADGSVTGRCRCSICDGSSLVSSGRLHTTGNDSGFLDQIDSVIGNDVNVQNARFGSQEYLNEEELSRYMFKDEDFDSSSCRCSFYASQTQSSGKHSRNNSGEDSIGKKSKTICLTKEQLVYLLQRVELSRYRMYMEERLADQGSIRKSQQKTIACLIQAVIIINKRMRSETDQGIKILADIKQLQLERAVYVKRQTRMRMCMCAMLCLYLLNIKAVRVRLESLISYFGIVETAKKINRTRKMIADNWRSIPSLLTNFWRIFIFRTNS